MEWPAWELQGYGTAAPAPEPLAPDVPDTVLGLGTTPRLDPLGPWFSARLSFADGARIDVLVAVSDDGLSVEDVRADPPLTLDGLATLARWIDGPLDDACRQATGRPRAGRPAPESTSEPAPAPGEGCGRAATGPAGVAAPAAEVVHGDGVLCAPAVRRGDGSRAAVPPGVPAAAVYDRATGSGAAPAAAPPDTLTRSRASERRKRAADAYRAAQEKGQDPVRAVMNATGRNRRRSLRLIAGARDEGFLAPRHNKR
ncbi:DUF6214 family protein [Streptomyces sp. NPDC048650]|uniref:DUF6214 family protein n=1 Tax=Streptomyces sp. NPDC048650 TaxID=3365583 RepID=UPI003711415A